MRLFVALDIDPEIRERITAFRNQMRALAPDVRWVGPETFHVTLQFLGETKKLDEIRHALQNGDRCSNPACISRRGILPQLQSSPRVLGRHRRRRTTCKRWQPKWRRRCFRWDLKATQLPSCRTSRWRDPAADGRDRFAASAPHPVCNGCATHLRRCRHLTSVQ